MIRQMINDLSDYHHTKDELMAEAVKTRLEDSYNTYVKELDNSVTFLKQRHELSILKRLNTYDKSIR